MSAGFFQVACQKVECGFRAGGIRRIVDGNNASSVSIFVALTFTVTLLDLLAHLWYSGWSLIQLLLLLLNVRHLADVRYSGVYHKVVPMKL